MSFLNKIQVLAGDVIDLKSKLKEKKFEDKKKKEDSLLPDFTKANIRVVTSNAFAGGYELQVTVQVSSEFIKNTKKDNKREFIRFLHAFVNDRIGKWMGVPAIDGFKARARNGMLTIRASWHFDNAYFAYALGLNLDDWHGSADVVKKNEIETRYALAEKAMKEMNTFRSVASKKLKLRSTDSEEQNKIWKEEFMADWVKLSEKWKQKGISYTALHNRSKQAVGFLNKTTAASEKLKESVTNLMNDTKFMKSVVPELLAASKAAIIVFHTQDKSDAIAFNQLVTKFLESLQRKNIDEAVLAANELIAKGHGGMFGLT